MGGPGVMVLDTCAVLWMAFSRDKFTPSTLSKLDSASHLIINSMCFWEIDIKVKKGKLEIPISVNELAGLYAGNTHVRIVAPDIGIILTSLELDWKHRDPVDRIVVATAQKENSPIVTSDKIIKKFYHPTTI
ncbi:MAG: PIN domain-containing protein [Chitinivibrionales bacterium]|nr:PIN domain-containing protein [Chitinivibrionales bacterium]